MSKKLFAFLMVFSLVLVPASSIAATTMAPLNSVPGPAGTFSSAFTIQNLSTAIATCSYQFFNSAGTAVVTSASFTIPVGGSNFTYVPSVAGLASGQYSGVVSCDQQVAAVVNSSSTNSGGSYGGVANTGTTWYVPNAYNNYYNYYTNLVVQNATSAPVNVTVQILNASGAVVNTVTQNNIPAYAYFNFEQTGLSGLATNVAYSAKVVGTGAIAVESNIFGLGAAVNQMYSYSPFTSGSLTAYTPVIMNSYFGYVTALTVQNLGSSPAHVTVTYGNGHTQTATIPVSSSNLFYTPSAGLPSGMLTSAKIVSDQAIVALVNEQNTYGRAASYSGFSAGSLKVSLPIVMKRYFNYNTSVTCQNVGTAPTNMTIVYSNAVTSTVSGVAANGTGLFYQPNEAGLANGFNGSATITSSSQPIVCVTNEDENEGTLGTTVFDQLFAYEGVAVP